jgi:hypothetical protein
MGIFLLLISFNVEAAKGHILCTFLKEHYIKAPRKLQAACPPSAGNVSNIMLLPERG